MRDRSAEIAFNHLNSLPIESRVIATPWSRIVRGIGLGQYPIDYNEEIANDIKCTLESMASKIGVSNPYNLFARRLVDLIFKIGSNNDYLLRQEMYADVQCILDAVRIETNPYLQVTAGSIAMDAFSKLGLKVDVIVSDKVDFPDELLHIIDRIPTSGSNDENSERHGDYERLSAFASLFLAFGQFGLTPRLVSRERNYILDALNCLERIPTPFFRGRGGAMLLSVIFLIGRGDCIVDGEKDYIKEVFDYLDRTEEIDIYPFFPQSLSKFFSKTYPLVTMLNAVAMSGRIEYLSYKKDRLLEMRMLWRGLERLERTHMGLYYIIALLNLGRLETEIEDINTFVKSIVEQLQEVDPGEDYFAHGLSYHYMIQTAMITGQLNLVESDIWGKLADSYFDLKRTHSDVINRPYTISYGINILGEIGRSKYIFSPRKRYSGKSAVEWVVDNLSDRGKAEGNRLYMLNNALISFALRMRGRQSPETELFSNFRFPLAVRR